MKKKRKAAVAHAGATPHTRRADPPVGLLLLAEEEPRKEGLVTPKPTPGALGWGGAALPSHRFFTVIGSGAWP